MSSSPPQPGDKDWTPAIWETPCRPVPHTPPPNYPKPLSPNPLLNWFQGLREPGLKQVIEASLGDKKIRINGVDYPLSFHRSLSVLDWLSGVRGILYETLENPSLGAEIEPQNIQEMLNRAGFGPEEESWPKEAPLFLSQAQQEQQFILIAQTWNELLQIISDDKLDQNTKDSAVSSTLAKIKGILDLIRKEWEKFTSGTQA